MNASERRADVRQNGRGPSSNVATGPGRAEWRRALDAARTLMASDCGWLELITRAILEERGVPYGSGLPVADAPSIPTDRQVRAMRAPRADDGSGRRRRGWEPPPADEDEDADGHAGRGETGETPAPRSDAPAEHSTRAKGRDGDHGAESRLSDAEERELPQDSARSLAGQYGSRMAASATYYPNLAAFVELWLANVFPYQQGPSVDMKWVADWWRYPALVFPLDALWRAYETARRQPNQMMIFYIQCSSVIDRLFNKNTGVVRSLETPQLTSKRPGEPLPCIRPPRAWRRPILERMEPPGAGERAGLDERTQRQPAAGGRAGRTADRRQRPQERQE